jgi:hypothetical protein
MAKKDKSPKLPKKVGGVKVPKQLRKSAKSALEIAQNPIARELVSAALVAGAAALTKRKVDKVAPASAEPAAHETDIGSLIAQSVAAFVTGFDKGAEMMAENIAPKAKPKSDPGPKA